MSGTDDTHQHPEALATIDIMGVCVSRDVFGLKDDREFLIGKYVRLSMPYFLDEEELDEDKLATESMLTGKKFIKRLKLDELNKRYRYLKTSGSDWVLIDLRALSYGLYAVNYGGETHYIMKERLTQQEICSAIEKRGYAVESIEEMEFEDAPNLNEMIDATCDFVKKRYGDKIILLEIRDGILRMDRAGRTAPMQREIIENRRREIERYTLLFKEKLGCRCIRMPAENICDGAHKWGYNPAHFVQEYYDYAFACIEDIVKGVPDLDRALDRRYMEFCAQLDAMRIGAMVSRNNGVKRVKRNLVTKKYDAALELASTLKNKANNPALEYELEGMIGRIWFEREDGNADAEEAEAHMREAAKGGISWCETYLLRILIDKGELDEMAEKAEEYAMKGNCEAMGYLGRAYRDGLGVDKDLDKAKEWMKKSAIRRVKWAKKEYAKLIEADPTS
ncbi:MAG: sel1 repeat family protein [Candidatus Methanomethylophilaceae archaeon]|nr:sel1 repeat family protein [Candidatus Methanomethylophilaceae archaeon]